MAATTKPRKSAKQARFDRQVCHTRRLLREFGAVETRPPQSGLFKIVAGDEWLLQTAYGPAQCRCAASYDGSLWLQIRMDYSDLCKVYGLHYKRGHMFDKDNTPEECRDSVYAMLTRVCRLHNQDIPTDPELEKAAAQFVKSEEDRATAWCEFHEKQRLEKL